MKVTIMYRNTFHGGDGWTYHPLRVAISDTCPKCGGKRGNPYEYRFHEDGQWFVVDRWDNPCGHVDSYRDAYFEQKAAKDAALTGAF